MSDPWLTVDSGPGESALNMAIDEALLLHVARLGRPVLRFYGWTEPAATFGYFQKYDDIARWTNLRPLIRRPSGGGLVPHLADWTYSLAFPPSHRWYALSAEESYHDVHDWLRAGFEILGIETSLAPEAIQDAPGQCFRGAEKHDLLWHGRKVAGAAQRRNRHGLLIQGSLQYQPPGVARPAWQAALRQAAAPGTEWIETELDPQTAAQASQLAADKYRQQAYNRKR